MRTPKYGWLLFLRAPSASNTEEHTTIHKLLHQGLVAERMCDSLKQGPSEVDCRPASQVVSRLSWTKFNCRVHKSFSLNSNLGQMIPFQIPIRYFSKMHSNIIPQSDYIWHALLTAHIRATWLALILTLIRSPCEYLANSANCGALHMQYPPSSNYLSLRIDIRFCTLFSKTLNTMFISSVQLPHSHKKGKLFSYNKCHRCWWDILSIQI
jgi:hypothetical protein